MQRMLKQQLDRKLQAKTGERPVCREHGLTSLTAPGASWRQSYRLKLARESIPTHRGSPFVLHARHPAEAHLHVVLQLLVEAGHDAGELPEAVGHALRAVQTDAGSPLQISCLRWTDPRK